jgi:hypothetical protein
MKLKKKHVDSRVKKIIAASNYTIYEHVDASIVLIIAINTHTYIHTHTSWYSPLIVFGQTGLFYELSSIPKTD